MVIRNVVPVHIQPDDDSEQVTQTLMGQSVSILEDRGDWLRARMWDAYTGWVQSFNVWPVDIPYASGGPLVQITDLCVDILEEPYHDAGIVTKVTLGVELVTQGELGHWLQLYLPDGSTGCIPAGSARFLGGCAGHTPVDTVQLLRTARRMIGIPYLWGGSSIFGLDCSGFVQLLYHTQGVSLPRDAWMQASDPQCLPVDRHDLHPGDLLFFAKGLQSGNDRITHVGMALDAKSFIHSCGSMGVVVTPLDNPYYSERYLQAGRIAR